MRRPCPRVPRRRCWLRQPPKHRTNTGTRTDCAARRVLACRRQPHQAIFLRVQKFTRQSSCVSRNSRVQKFTIFMRVQKFTEIHVQRFIRKFMSRNPRLGRVQGAACGGMACVVALAVADAGRITGSPQHDPGRAVVQQHLQNMAERGTSACSFRRGCGKGWFRPFRPLERDRNCIGGKCGRGFSLRLRLG